jgi:replicative DNA helicase
MSALEDQLAGLNSFAVPFSNDAEQGVLSCILQDPEERLSEAKLELLPDAFYHYANRAVFEALLGMADKAVPINPVSLTHALRVANVLDKVGGPAALSELFAFVPIPAHWPYFLSMVKSKWLDRQTLAALMEGIATVRDREQNGMTAEGALNSSQERLFGVKVSAQEGDGGKEYQEVLGEVIDGVMDQLEHVAIIPADRVPFGFVGLDRRMWGAVRGQFIVLAARPSMGKSALASNIAGNVSRGTGDYVEWQGANWPHRVRKRVIYFELEMTNKQSGTRDLVGGAGLDLQAMRYGLPLRDAHDKLGRRMREIKDSNMRKYDRPGMSLQKMRAICRRQNRKQKIDLIVIDYLQLMTSESKRAKENRQLEIAEISAGLKEMAKELDCVVLALAQLSRSVEERKDKKPMLSDLRESGSIEQDADAVMFLMRPWYYDEKHEPKDQAFLILAKGRDVGIGEMELRFEGHLTRFTSLGMDGDRHLLSNDEEKRDGGYQSKPQACKQQEPAAVKLDNKKTVAKGGGRMKWNGTDWVPPGHPSLGAGPGNEEPAMI